MLSALWLSTRLWTIFRKAPGHVVHTVVVHTAVDADADLPESSRSHYPQAAGSPSHKTKGQKTSRPQRLLNSWPYSSIVLNPYRIQPMWGSTLPG